MTFRTKLRLLWKLSDYSQAVVLVAILLVAAWYFELDPDGAKLLAALWVFFAPWAFVTAWIKFQSVLAVLKDGKRVDATVRETTLSSRGDDSPDLYALSWRDDDGYLGQSLPAPIETFSDYGEGDRIIVYRNDQRESWWERDVFGPVIR